MDKAIMESILKEYKANEAYEYSEGRVAYPTDTTLADVIDAMKTCRDMRGLQLRGMNFSDTDFQSEFALQKKYIVGEIELFNPDIKETLFDEADLENAKFIDSNLKFVYFRHSFLMDTDFSEANLSQARFHGAKLYRTVFDNTNATYVYFDEATLSEMKMLSSDLTGASFKGCKFKDNKITGSIFSRADFRNAEIEKIDFSGLDLSEAKFCATSFKRVKFVETNLTEANCEGQDFSYIDFSGATLTNANLSKCILDGASFKGANLSGTDLRHASLVNTNFEGANLTNAAVYGCSAWDIQTDEKTNQKDIIVTPKNSPTITVDELVLAQFIYLLIDNKNVRSIIDTVTTKVVLILGRFTEERKEILDAIREKLRLMNLTPILFDFDKPNNKDVTGTVETLARMAYFIIADLTEPSSIPHELATIIPLLRTTPVRPIKLLGSKEYSMIEDYQVSYGWVMKTFEYVDKSYVVENILEVINPAKELAGTYRKK